MTDFNENLDVGDSGLDGVDGERHRQTGKYSGWLHTVTVDFHFTGVMTDSTCFHLVIQQHEVLHVVLGR